MIPKIIHQIYLSEGEIIKEFRPAWRASWTKHFPEWEYKLWRIKDINNFLKTKCTAKQVMMYRTFEAIGGKVGIVLRADLLRYLILNEYGGIYADLDCLCVKNFEHLLDVDFFAQSDIAIGHDNHIGIHLFATTPNHKFLNKVLECIEKNINNKVFNKRAGCVINGTGPILAYKAFKKTSGLKLYKDTSFCKWLRPTYNKGMNINESIRKESLNGTYAIHISCITWAHSKGSTIKRKPKIRFRRNLDSNNPKKIRQLR